MSDDPVEGTLSVELVARGKKALVVGACRECALKLPRLLAAGARVHVVADGAVDPLFVESAARGDIVLERRAFEDGDWEGAVVTFVSPEHEAIGARLAERATATGRLVSTLDRPLACTFINPAVVERQGLKVTLSSGGAAPALLRRLREDLERAFDDPTLGELVRALRDVRRGLPKGERSVELRRLVEGFGLEVSFTFPAWLSTKSDGAKPK